MSSSGHLVLVPRLLGWSYAELDPAARKSFEVAVHLGSAAALALVTRSELAALRAHEVWLVALTAVPPAAAGLAFERLVERHLGSVRSVALAQVVAGAGLWLADRTPTNRTEAGVIDALAVGGGQAAALWPGVSRSGAAITVARLRGLDRPASARLSRRAALPIAAGSAAWKGFRAARAGLPHDLYAPFAAGALTALASGLAARGLARRVEHAGSYAPFSVYRIALGLSALLR